MRVIPFVVVAGLTCALAGCGGDGGSSGAATTPAAAPAGLRTAQNRYLSVALPASWRTEVSTPAGRQTTLEARSPTGSAGIASAILVGVTPGTDDGVEDLATLNVQSKKLRFPGVVIEEPREVDVEGADGARRIDASVQVKANPDGTAQIVRPGTTGALELRLVDVLARSTSGNSVDLAFQLAPGSDVDVDAIVKTLRLR